MEEGGLTGPEREGDKGVGGAFGMRRRGREAG